MKREHVLFVIIIGVALTQSAVALAQTLDQLVTEARKEGAIEFYAPSTLTPQGAQALGDAFNKKYQLKIKVNYSPAGQMARDVAKVLTFAAAGAAPEWDLMVVTDAHHATLWLKKQHKPLNYGMLGVDRRAIQYDNGTVILANQFVLPAYNKKTLPPQDVPKTWEDLLAPKWKDGKWGMSTATHHLARLASAWGEKKTTEYVQALAKQQPFLGELGAIYTRLQLGETLVAITMTDSFIHTARTTGAPIVHAEGVVPVISPAYNAGVLKGAQHPNAAHLFAVFLTTPEAQALWEKYGGQTSAFVPGTRAYKYAQGKKVLYMAQEEAETVDRLAKEYSKILGFN
ncbi:MAG: ABC transporter substrate-binding protein [Deltaproteobacteria bacterium]